MYIDKEGQRVESDIFIPTPESKEDAMKNQMEEKSIAFNIGMLCKMLDQIRHDLVMGFPQEALQKANHAIDFMKEKIIQPHYEEVPE